MASNSKTPDRELSEPAFHAKYGYYAGWDDARNMVYEAMVAAKRDLNGPWPILHALWKSMDNDARIAKLDAYVREVDGS